LVVNYFRDKNSQTLPEALTTETPNSVEVGKNYKVEKGETLWSISEDAYGSGYNWMDIYKANNLKYKLTQPNLIHPGNVLVLPR
jgi:nucleoid-associated protein YgaU